MVFANQYAEVLVKTFPKFAKSDSLKETIELYSDGKTVSAYTIFTGLTNYVINELMAVYAVVSEEELAIYQYVEEIRKKFSNSPEDTEEFDIDNAACTCFLEDLINIASHGRISFERFIPYLGEKSKEFCRAWDEFTGVKSPGLW